LGQDPLLARGGGEPSAALSVGGRRAYSVRMSLLASPSLLATGIPYHSFPIISLGPLNLRTFGLFVAVGILIGISVASRRNERFGIPRRDTERVGFILVVSGLVGARLLWAATHVHELGSPLDVIAVWKGGLQFSGGLITAVLIAPIVTRSWQRTQRWSLLDGAIFGLAIGQCIGRFGCISVGEHLGGPTDFFLGMHYLGGITVEGPLVIGETYNNAAIYEVLWLIPVIAVLWWLDRRGARPGVMSAVFLISYGVLRFLTDIVRTHDERVLGLTGAQYMCLVLVPFGLWVLWTAFRPVEVLEFDAESVDAEPDQPVGAEPADAEPADAEPADAEPADAKPADAKPVEDQPVEDQPVEDQGPSSESANQT